MRMRWERKKKMSKVLWFTIESMKCYSLKVKSVHHSRLTAPAPRSPSAPIHQCGTSTGLPAAAPKALPFESNCRAHVSNGSGGPTMLAVGLFGTLWPFAASLEVVIVNLLEIEKVTPPVVFRKIT
jgi:hypothetical protein